MRICSRCKSTLNGHQQNCGVCGEKHTPTLPTLHGFGQDLEHEDFKTVQSLKRSTKSEMNIQKEATSNALNKTNQENYASLHQTEPLISPIPTQPLNRYSADEAPIDKFDSNDQYELTQVGLRNGLFEELEFSSVSDAKTEITELEESIDMTISEEVDLNAEDLVEELELNLKNKKISSFNPTLMQSIPAPFTESTAPLSPPPIPPALESFGGSHYRNVRSPFSKHVEPQLETKESAKVFEPKVFWFGEKVSQSLEIIDQFAELQHPTQKKRLAKVKLEDDSFAFEGALNQEIWQPAQSKFIVEKTHTLRSGDLILKLVEMTIEESEVISQPSIAVWQLKSNQERVFYGAFNLFPGVSRVGGTHCEITLPLQTTGPLFSLELDPNGSLWCHLYPQHELWSLVHYQDQFTFGSILATQGLLFTVIKA